MMIQKRVIWALCMREVLTRFGRRNIGFLWLFVEPMLFTLIIAMVVIFIRHSHFGVLSPFAFAVTGYATVMLWRNMPSRCLHALESNASLLYHRHVKIIDIYFARILLEAAGATMALVFMICFFSVFGIMALPKDPLKVCVGWLMLAWFGFSLALFIGPASERSKFVEIIWKPLSYILFPFSGAMFVVDMLPPEAQKPILLFPMVHGVELLREGYFGPVIKFHYDLGYMAAINLLLMVIGFSQLRHVSNKRHPE
jgi:ABC-type polysaccharide/polyol phosphate export permease